MRFAEPGNEMTGVSGGTRLDLSIVHVKSQLGHSSIQLMVDTYSQSCTGADVSYVESG